MDQYLPVKIVNNQANTGNNLYILGHFPGLKWHFLRCFLTE